MSHRLRHILQALALSLGLTAGAFADTDSLEKNSPFLPPGYKPPAQRPTTPTTGTKTKPKPKGKLEFRGAAKLDGTWEFSIYDVKKRRGYWVSMNDPKAPYLVTSYNEKAQSITLGGGASQTLKLKEPSQRRMPGSYRAPRATTPRATTAPKTNTTSRGTRPTPSTSSRSPRSSGNTSRPGDIPPDIKALLDSLK